ncbi:PadR family transcriptional regulator [Paenibacillus daejeonensis]|uniref:PadR family transcriptional regulator n=1 Tax=Paenibacillus daejeonensis TaxID=135193 RepID=UPI000382B929|nr:PadR family transcriptional regulator [Paenibacillus daejeonensis]
MKISKELLKGSTAILILSQLERSEMYGYELVKEIEKRSEGVFALKEGTLYPLLHAMEAEEWVESYWSQQHGRKRKYYRITEKGLKGLHEKKQEWQTFRVAVERVVGEGTI